MAKNDTPKTKPDKRRGRTTRHGGGRRTTRRRPKWLPDDEPVQTPEPAPPAPKAEAPEPAAAPEPKPAPEPVRPTWGAADWVTVRYDGPDWFIHPQAGVFVPGTTARLRGDLAATLPDRGFRFSVEALRRAG